MSESIKDYQDPFDLVILHFAIHCGVAGNAHTLKNAILKRKSDVEITVVDVMDDEAIDAISESKHIVGHELTQTLLEKATKLRWFQSIGSGAEHLDLQSMRKKGIRVTNARGVNAEPMAEQAIGAMLFFERRFGQAIRQQGHHEWRRFPAGELSSKTLAIVGLGAVGKRVVELGKAFSMKVLGVEKDVVSYDGPADELYPSEKLRFVLGQSDYIVIAVPATPETHHMFSTREFASMKTSAVLINMARGEIVDTEALIAALQEGAIAGAAFDVVENEPLDSLSPLWDFGNVLITPHTGGSTPKYLSRLADLIVDNINRIIRNGYNNLRNQII